MERFETAPTLVRAAVVWLGDRLLGIGKSAPAVARKVSMLDVVYGRSALLASEGPVGSRVPDVVGGDGRRLLGDQWSAIIVNAGCEEAAHQLAAALDLPLVDGDVAGLVTFFGRDRFVALIRPDRIVGWLGDANTVDIGACAAALSGGKVRRTSTQFY